MTGFCLQCSDSFKIEQNQSKTYPFCPYCDSVINGKREDGWIPVLVRKRKQVGASDEGEE